MVHGTLFLRIHSYYTPPRVYVVRPQEHSWVGDYLVYTSLSGNRERRSCRANRLTGNRRVGLACARTPTRATTRDVWL